MASTHIRNAQERFSALWHWIRYGNPERKPNPLLILQLFVLLLCLGAFVRAAWVSDDAFIALRSVYNVVRGHGLVSNPGERVQGFTSPLWILLLTVFFAFTGEAYFTTIDISLVVSGIVAGLLILKVAVRPLDGICIGLLLAFSRAATDYATSGLENPLIHLLITLFLIVYFRGKSTRADTFSLFLIAGLLCSTRMDTVLLTLPVLLHHTIVTRSRKHLPFMVLGFVPLIAWLVFSLVYYGFPFPNTAYAKLNLELAGGKLAMQGFGYLLDSFTRDPLTLLIVVFTLTSAVALRKVRAIVPMIGVLLYLFYILKVGGDFMSGRFLTGCFIVSLAVLGAWVLPSLSRLRTLGVSGIAVLVIVSAPYNPLGSSVEPCRVPDHGVTDERGCYEEHTGLLRNVHHSGEGRKFQRHEYWKAGIDMKEAPETVFENPRIGLAGYAAGPDVHIVDPAALTDPLLARIPFRPSGKWRIGHFYRKLPAGYLETLRSGQNQIEDPCLRQYYDNLSLVIRGPIFTIERFKTILELNLGTHDHLLAEGCEAPPDT